MARLSDIAPVDDVMFNFIAAISANVHPRALGSQAARSYIQYDNRKYRKHISIPGQIPAIGVSITHRRCCVYYKVNVRVVSNALSILNGNSGLGRKAG
jgi:hypothetical protein